MVRRPEGYPRELERSVTLSDGRGVRVRPVVPGDADALVHAIRTADAQTLRARFLGGAPPSHREDILRLVEVDYTSRLALVAFGEGRGVAIARYEPVPDQPGTVEVAVAIDPQWRRVGLATALIRLLAEAAAVRGITEFTAMYFANNVDVASIIADTGLVHAPLTAGGVVDDAVRLPPLVEIAAGEPPCRRTVAAGLAP